MWILAIVTLPGGMIGNRSLLSSNFIDNVIAYPNLLGTIGYVVVVVVVVVVVLTT